MFWLRLLLITINLCGKAGFLHGSIYAGAPPQLCGKLLLTVHQRPVESVSTALRVISLVISALFAKVRDVNM